MQRRRAAARAPKVAGLQFVHVLPFLYRIQTRDAVVNLGPRVPQITPTGILHARHLAHRVKAIEHYVQFRTLFRLISPYKKVQ
jgi:hypothetical protein